MSNQEIINDLTSIRDYFDVVLNSRCDEVVAQLLTKYKKTIEDMMTAVLDGRFKNRKVIVKIEMILPEEDMQRLEEKLKNDFENGLMIVPPFCEVIEADADELEVYEND